VRNEQGQREQQEGWHGEGRAMRCAPGVAADSFADQCMQDGVAAVCDQVCASMSVMDIHLLG